MSNENSTNNGNGTAAGNGGGSGIGNGASNGIGTVNTNETGPDAVLTAQAVEAARESLRAMREGMTFLTTLTPQSRKGAERLAPSELRMIEEALEVAREVPGLLPAGIDLARFTGGVDTCRGLMALLKELEGLCVEVRDTLAVRSDEPDEIRAQLRLMVRSAARRRATPTLKLLAGRLDTRRGRTAEESVSEVPPAPAAAPSAAAKDPGAAPPSVANVA